VKPPLLGESRSGRACTRWLGDRDCGKPPVAHVIWDEEMENGLVCVEHLAEVGRVWSFWRIHPIGPDCIMPGSEYFVEENVCRCPGDLGVSPIEIAHAAA
jgi:hypothetical protein